MAVTDRLASFGLQPRVWSVTVQGLLTSKLPDINQGGWLVNAAGLESGVDAVSLTDGDVQRQWVFFARGGEVLFLDYDNDSFDASGPLPRARGADPVFRNTDLAAVVWDDDGTPRMAVAAVTTDEAICIWDGTFEDGFTRDPSCTGPAQAGRSDLDGTVVDGVPVFVYRDPGIRLVLPGKPKGTPSARSPRGVVWTAAGVSLPDRVFWLHKRVGTPPDAPGIRASLAAWPSQAEPGRVEAAVVAGDTNRTLWTVRALPLFDGRAGRPRWQPVPDMPGGARPDFAGPTLAATRFSSFDPATGGLQPRTMLYVKSEDDRLYRRRSDDEGQWNTGGASWLAGAAGAGARPPEQSWLSTGVAVTVNPLLLFGETPVVYGAGGSTEGPFVQSTLQEFRETGFRDHIRWDHGLGSGIVAGSTDEGTRPANEGTVSIAPSGVGIATAIRRNTRVPWEVVVTDTFEDGDRWSQDHVVQQVLPWGGDGTPSYGDPYAAQDTSGLKHHLVIQAEFDRSAIDERLCSRDSVDAWRMLYRRGTTASAIASLDDTSDRDLLVLQEGFVDHGNLVLVENPGTAATAHAVWYDVGRGAVRHARIEPGATTSEQCELTAAGPVQLDTALQAGAFVDAAGTVYAWSGAAFGGGEWPQICRIGGGPDGLCCQAKGFVANGGAGGVPRSEIRKINFAPKKGAPKFCNGSGGACFGTEEPFAFATDPIIPARIYVAYQGRDEGDEALSIFFIRNDEPRLDAWTEHTKISARSLGDTRHFIDPEITVDHDGTIVVTYSGAHDPETDNEIERFVTWSTDGGATWEDPVEIGDWDPADLPFHCGRRTYFLGEYREPDVTGARAFHPITASTGGHTVYRGMWASRWSVLPR